MVDLIDLPFNFVHEMYRTAFITSQEQKEKAEKEAAEQKKKEEAERREARQANNASRSPVRTSSMPMKKNVQMSPQPSDQMESVPSMGMNDLDAIEELIEEGF